MRGVTSILSSSAAEGTSYRLAVRPHTVPSRAGPVRPGGGGSTGAGTDRPHGATTIDLREVDDVGDAIRDLTDGRGADAVVDAVGMEAHGNVVAEFAQRMAARMPAVIGKPMLENVGVDRLDAIYTAIDACRRGGTVSLAGVYGGAADPMPMLTMFDKQLQFRMGQCNVKKWTSDLMPYVTDDADPLGTADLVTHRVPLEDAPAMYDTFMNKEDGCIKVVIEPNA
ncbi:MAG: hypothetical protein WEB03_02365 [Nitriliruptor sp.]|uniref:hypothetical protein n=1 Tax=Nitriliruptor sp. TaxID=2448056 RepID=UPI00349FEA77